MKKIPSFTVDHIRLQRGIFVSRKDEVGGEIVTTFDIRMKEPNREPALGPAAIHTIEHLAATFLRNHPVWADKIIYWGPMGCLTGNYLIVKGDLQSKDIAPLMTETFRFIAIADKGSRDHTRVACTIDILDLNRELMVAARRDAFKDYSAHLSTYVTEKQAGASPEELAEIQSTICSRQHPTVWREMQRQRDKHPKIQQLFQKAPEAATWQK